MKSTSPEPVSQSKSQIREAMIDQLSRSFPELRAQLGDRKFLKRAKKAARLLTKGLSDKKVKGQKKGANLQVDSLVL